MDKPHWRRISSRRLIDSAHMRLRVDTLELPDGTVVEDYYVRESDGFVVVVPFTPQREVVLVAQYRYGSDAVHLEVPAGGLHAGEDPQACAARELLEETGYRAARWESLGAYFAEPARGNSVARLFVAFDAVEVARPQLEPTEALQVEVVTLPTFRAMLADGRIDVAHAIVAGYRALDRLNLL